MRRRYGAGGRRRKGGALPAAEALGKLLEHHGVARELREHRILAMWRGIVGDNLAGRTSPDGLERGVLWVRVRNASWLHQLSFLKGDIIRRIQDALGDPPLVTDVRFHLGPCARISDDDTLAPTVRIRRQAVVEREPPPAATGERLRAIEREAEAIGDHELREVVVELRRRWNL